MGKTKKKGEGAFTEESKTPEAKGTRYVCISAHDEPRGPGCHVKRIVGQVDTFDKNPGPCWRPETDSDNEEVT